MKSSCVWNRKVQLGFGAAILTLLGSGVISYRALVVSNQSQGWVRHTHQVLEELQEVLSANQNIESSSRGFVLTGDKSYIKSFKGNILQEAKAERSVDELTIDNPSQQRRVAPLKKLVAENVRFNDSVNELRRGEGVGGGGLVVWGGEVGRGHV